MFICSNAFADTQIVAIDNSDIQITPDPTPPKTITVSLDELSNEAANEQAIIDRHTAVLANLQAEILAAQQAVGTIGKPVDVSPATIATNQATGT